VETPHLSDLRVGRESGIAIATQLVWQLKHQIESGRLGPGMRLPGVREAARALRVNVNTVRAVYAELEADGYVVARQGSGTFVTDRPPTRSRSDELQRVAVSALAEARRMGFDVYDLAAAAIAQAVPKDAPARIVFVECNAADVEEGCAALTDELGDEAQVEGMLIQDVRRGERPDADALVTTVFHVRELERLAGRPVVGLMVSSGYLAALTELTGLPDGAEIAVLCPSREGTRALQRMLREAGVGARLRGVPRWDDVERVRRIVGRADAVLVSRNAIQQGALDPLDGAPVRIFSYGIDPAGFPLVREALTRAARGAPAAAPAGG